MVLRIACAGGLRQAGDTAVEQGHHLQRVTAGEFQSAGSGKEGFRRGEVGIAAGLFEVAVGISIPFGREAAVAPLHEVERVGFERIGLGRFLFCALQGPVGMHGRRVGARGDCAVNEVADVVVYGIGSHVGRVGTGGSQLQSLVQVGFPVGIQPFACSEGGAVQIAVGHLRIGGHEVIVGGLCPERVVLGQHIQIGERVVRIVRQGFGDKQCAQVRL